ncbi:MAG: hypothetical protein WBD78_16600, partial [Methylocella sp.]
PRPSLFESVFEKVQPRKWPGFTPPRSRIMPPLRGLLLLRRVQAKRDLAPVLEARPQIAQELSRALAQQQNAGRALATVERDETEEKGRLSTWFSERIHELFDLKRAH